MFDFIRRNYTLARKGLADRYNRTRRRFARPRIFAFDAQNKEMQKRQILRRRHYISIGEFKGKCRDIGRDVVRYVIRLFNNEIPEDAKNDMIEELKSNLEILKQFCMNLAIVGDNDDSEKTCLRIMTLQKRMLKAHDLYVTIKRGNGAWENDLIAYYKECLNIIKETIGDELVQNEVGNLDERVSFFLKTDNEKIQKVFENELLQNIKPTVYKACEKFETDVVLHVINLVNGNDGYVANEKYHEKINIGFQKLKEFCFAIVGDNDSEIAKLQMYKGKMDKIHELVYEIKNQDENKMVKNLNAYYVECCSMIDNIIIESLRETKKSELLDRLEPILEIYINRRINDVLDIIKNIKTKMADAVLKSLKFAYDGAFKLQILNVSSKPNGENKNDLAINKRIIHILEELREKVKTVFDRAEGSSTMTKDDVLKELDDILIPRNVVATEPWFGGRKTTRHGKPRHRCHKKNIIIYRRKKRRTSRDDYKLLSSKN